MGATISDEKTGVASTLSEACNLLEQSQPDLVFLDIELGADSGFALLEYAPNKQMAFGVIFTTAHKQYGIRAIKFSALDYLLKPIQESELVSAVDKAVRLRLDAGRARQIEHLLALHKLKEGQELTIAVALSRELRFLQLSEILQVKASNNYSLLQLTSEELIMVSKGIYYFDKLLRPSGFLRVHQSHLVNARYIRAFKNSGRSHQVELFTG